METARLARGTRFDRATMETARLARGTHLGIRGVNGNVGEEMSEFVGGVSFMV